MKKKVLGVVALSLILGGFAFATVVSAELTEAEKKAIETQLKAAELAKEATKTNAPAPVQAPEPVQVQDPAPVQAPAVVTATSAGYIKAVNGSSITVGIFEGNTFAITANTALLLNGKTVLEPSLEPVTTTSMFVGDKVTVTYNASTKEAVVIETEGRGRQSSATSFTGASVCSVGNIIGDIWGWDPILNLMKVLDPNFGMSVGYSCSTPMLLSIDGVPTMVSSGFGPGVFLTATETQVSINGTPATINDIRAGDVINYTRGIWTGVAYFVEIMR